MPKFDFSLNKKIDTKSQSMKELNKDAMLGESSNMFMPPEPIVPACSLEPISEYRDQALENEEALWTPKALKQESYLNITDQQNQDIPAPRKTTQHINNASLLLRRKQEEVRDLFRQRRH